MKFLIFAGLLAVAFSAPIEHEEHPVEFELKQHSDVDGSYSFTYASDDSSKTETRTPEGVIRGAYSYIDSDGVLQKVQYVADENGFQAYGTNLPVGSTVPVKETPEVLEATAQHFALVDEHVKKIDLAKKLHEEFLRIHPELFPEETGHTVVHHVVHHVEPVFKKVVTPFVKKVTPVVHHVSPVIKKVDPVVHHVQHHVPVVKKLVPVVHHSSFVAPKPFVKHEEHYHGIPVAPEEDEEVKLAREAHLALVEKLTAEHLAAVAAAPKYAEE